MRNHEKFSIRLKKERRITKRLIDECKRGGETMWVALKRGPLLDNEACRKSTGQAVSRKCFKNIKQYKHSARHFGRFKSGTWDL